MRPSNDPPLHARHARHPNGHGAASGWGVTHPRVHRRRLGVRHPARTGRSVADTVGLAVGVGLIALAVLVTGTVGVAGTAAVAALSALSSDLPDPSALDELTFSQPTIVYDRTGERELGRFMREQRSVVEYAAIPPLVLDVTVTAEDRTFWENEGFDAAAILAAVTENASGVSERGASTITQQLVRARLLPDQYVEPGADRYVRKAKEIIQSVRLTAAHPGEEGKRQIITAYLNEIFYGHDAYGIAAAARVYFGVNRLAELTPAQAALLAGLPKSPSTLDPYRYATEDAEGRLVVDPESPPVVRRNWILRNLAESRWTRLSPKDLQTSLNEPVILAGDRPLTYVAPHFTWQVRRQLEQIVGSRDAIETGGFRVITTLDVPAQRLAEKWITAAVVAPNLRTREQQERMLERLKIGEGDLAWVRALRGKDLHNASLVALDYRTGDVLAYVGSAGYYRDNLRSPKFDPKYDAAGDGTRQPGSAFKPIVYATAFETGTLTPGSLLLDVTTEFNPREDWAPRDADNLDRGPVLVRRALQYSLNIPAIRALERVGNEAVAAQAERMGVRFQGGTTAFLQSGLAGAIGTVEVRPLDLTSAYGTLANGGVRVPPRLILEVRDAAGNVVWKAPKPEGEQVVSPGTAFLVTDILSGNTDPRQNPIWAEKLMIRNGPDRERRPAAVKTGTANDARDLATYGYLPAPEGEGYALAVGIWMGNSDHSTPRTEKPATSLTAAAPLWRAFVRDLTNKQPVTRFARPDDVVRTRIDAWSGGAPGPWTRTTIREWFRRGTQPGADGAVDPPGLLYSRGCAGWMVDPLKAELGPSAWDADVEDWLRRARRGVGVEGRHESATAYFWGESSWGGPLLGPCRVRSDDDEKDEDKEDRGKGKDGDPGDGPGNGNGNGGGGEGDVVIALPV
ncbi:MAG TPA: transglycosylase domain-containing protein [Candidatus Limnocylindrales bacterium]|nr:transglycosylase domain-containing protein [Candidatus Limnocylindrales bacterium]